MSPSAKKCWFCTVPIVVVVGVLIGFAASAAVSQWRIGQIEEKLVNQESHIERLRETSAEVKAMRRVLDRVETKLDRLSDQQPK